MSEDRSLSIYLNDHLAGAIAGVELAKRAAANNKENLTGSFLRGLANDIDEDRQVLEELMSKLGIRKDLLKDAAAWLGEKVGRLKLNGKLIGYSNLSHLVELEGLSLGVEGKLSMWRNLAQVREKHVPLRGSNLDELIRRAEAQRDELAKFRQEAATAAL